MTYVYYASLILGGLAVLTAVVLAAVGRRWIGKLQGRERKTDFCVDASIAYVESPRSSLLFELPRRGGATRGLSPERHRGPEDIISDIESRLEELRSLASGAEATEDGESLSDKLTGIAGEIESDCKRLRRRLPTVEIRRIEDQISVLRKEIERVGNYTRGIFGIIITIIIGMAALVVAAWFTVLSK